MRQQLWFAMAAMTLGSMSPSWAQNPPAPDLRPVATLDVQGKLTDDDGAPAHDISGIDCLPPSASARQCLVINDEDRSAQFVSIEKHRLIPGSRVRLIDKKPSKATLGNPPQDTACSAGEAKFKDLDGEAVAFAAPYFYVAGSHGCSRHGNKFRLSSFILARIRVDGTGRPIDREGKTVDDTETDVSDAVETTYRLAEVLRSAESVGPFFGHDLEAAGTGSHNGLNLEGVAVTDGT